MKTFYVQSVAKHQCIQCTHLPLPVTNSENVVTPLVLLYRIRDTQCSIIDLETGYFDMHFAL